MDGKRLDCDRVGQRATRLDRNFNFSLDFPWVGDSKAEKDEEKIRLGEVVGN